MTKTKIIIIAGLICIVLGIAFAWLSSRETTQDFTEDIERAQTNTSNNSSNPNSSTTSFSPPVADKLIIDGVTMRNFYTTERARSAGNVVFYENIDYQFSYVIDYNEFIINITTADFENVRPLAEQGFVSNLQITTEQACQLNVIVQNPSVFNPNSNDQVYKLSFCE